MRAVATYHLPFPNRYLPYHDKVISLCFFILRNISSDCQLIPAAF